MGSTQRSVGRSISSFDPKGYLTQRDFNNEDSDDDQPSAFDRVNASNRKNKGV